MTEIELNFSKTDVCCYDKLFAFFLYAFCADKQWGFVCAVYGHDYPVEMDTHKQVDAKYLHIKCTMAVWYFEILNRFHFGTKQRGNLIS